MSVQEAKEDVLDVECVQGLWGDETYIHGRAYKISKKFWDQHPEHFKPVGYLASEQERLQREAEERAKPTNEGQDRYERMRDTFERQEAQNDLARARAERDRLKRLEEQVSADEKDAETRIPSGPVPPPPPPPEEPIDKGPAPPTLGANVPRAERMKAAQR